MNATRPAAELDHQQAPHQPRRTNPHPPRPAPPPGGRRYLTANRSRTGQPEKGHPTLVTTNRGLPAWGQIFGDAVVAAAILDRLMHKAIVFNIRGPSWRLREHNGLEIATTNPDR